MAAFVHALPVAFADVDHAGLVYYPRYFDYFHRAFEALWRERAGAAAYAALVSTRHLGFPAVRAAATFVAPLRFGDVAEVELTITRRGTTSITFGYTVWRQAPRTRCAHGEVVCAVVDLVWMVSVVPPDDVLAVLAGLDAI